MKDFFNICYDLICESMNDIYTLQIYGYDMYGEISEELDIIENPFQTIDNRIYIEVPLWLFQSSHIERISGKLEKINERVQLGKSSGPSFEETIFELMSNEWEHKWSEDTVIFKKEYPIKNGIKKIEEEFDGIKICIKIPETHAKLPNKEISGDNVKLFI